jgi:lipopolysaccharide transport system ATP-binding protein
MPAIEAFAEIGEFFDQPVRVYSSGMQARLAFALATAKRPDILIVDEVLSVGDSYFQHKSFDRIRQFKEQGTAILLVTHGLGDVKALCERVILLDKGMIVKDGPPDEVVDYYNAMVAERENSNLTIQQKRNSDGWLHTRSGSYEARVETIELLDQHTLQPVNTARVGQHLLLRLEVRAYADILKLVLGYMLRDRTGHVIWGTNTWHTKQVIENVMAGGKIIYELPFTCTLGPGSYSFSPALVNSDTHLDKNYEWQDNALVFDVVNAGQFAFIGSTWLDATFRIARVD